jgi:hypothetical protein
MLSAEQKAFAESLGAEFIINVFRNMPTGFDEVRINKRSLELIWKNGHKLVIRSNGWTGHNQCCFHAPGGKELEWNNMYEDDSLVVKSSWKYNREITWYEYMQVNL